MLQLLVVVCSELRWNALSIFPPSLLPWWVTFLLVYPQSACRWLCGTCRWRAWWHLSLFSPVGGLFCLTCQVFYFGPLVCPCHPLHCSICFLVLLPVSLFQPLWSCFSRALLLSMACQVSAMIHSFLSSVGVLGRLHWSAYSFFWSAPTWCCCRSCQAVYVFQHLPVLETCSSVEGWRYSLLQGSFSFFMSNCCCLALPGPFLLSFSFRVAVTRWWSLPTSAPLLTLTSCNDLLLVPLIIRWSIWFLSLPLGGGGGTRWAYGFHGEGRVSFQWRNRMFCRIQVASLHCCSCCHILPFPLLYRDLCCHFPLSHSSRPSLSSSHGVVFSLARLATGRRMHPCSLPHCRWSVHSTEWWWCWCASPSFWSSSACCWSASILLGTSPSFPQDYGDSLVVLVVVSPTL